MFFALWDVRVSVLQIAMVYGPAQPDLTKLVPYATLAFCAATHRSCRVGHGWSIGCTWTMSLMLFVRTAEADTAIGRVLDIGSGRLVSIRDTVELLASIIGGTRATAVQRCC